MKTEATILCPSCEAGQLREKRIDYTVTAADGVKVMVPKLLVEACDQCNEIILSADAAAAVDIAIAEKTEQLTKQELGRIREELEVDQTQMSEILGLGGKTYHRWEKGNQVPSRSMGYYLRVLAEFPEAFTWLRARGWHGRKLERRKMVVVDFKAFPHLPITYRGSIVDEVPRVNRARALFTKAA